MKSFLFSALGAAIGTTVGLVLLFFAAVAFLSSLVGGLNAPAEMPEEIVLSLDLRTPLPDQTAKSGPEVFFGAPLGFVDVLLKLESARTDDRVKGIFIRASEGGIGSSRAEELRAAFKALQSDGKFVIAHSQGSYGGGPSGYRAIAAADEIWVQPGTDLIAAGVTFESVFAKNLLDRLGITADIYALHEFKNAPSTFKETGFTEAHRLAMSRLGQSIWEVSLANIAEDRKISVADAKQALEASPLSYNMLIEMGLADAEGWPEGAADAALLKGGQDAAFVNLYEYTPPTSAFGSPAIAIIGGQGPIITGGDNGSLFNEGSAFASDTIAAAFYEAAENEKVEAIVFRVDSPGGSPTASDQILRAMTQVQTEYGKPVIVSMGGVAASGGYYVSAGAERIVASNTTITGSIGVFGGKFAFAEGLERIGVNTDAISIGGPFSGAFTRSDRFSEEQKELLMAFLQRTYDRFVAIVAEGRGLSIEKANEVAKGRVWTGQDALENGLIDEIGGLITAVKLARSAAEIPEGSDIRIVQYPKTQPLMIGGSVISATATDAAKAAAFAKIFNDPEFEALLTEFNTLRSTSTPQARAPALRER